jgi:hypothetical protein
MPQRYRGSPEREREREREARERDSDGWRGMERRQRISDILGGIKRNHQQRARAQ